MLGLQFRVTQRHLKRGDMKLKCLATIATVYVESKEESVRGVPGVGGNSDNDERNVLKAPESRETRAQSHTRNDNGHNGTKSFSHINQFFVNLISSLKNSHSFDRKKKKFRALKFQKSDFCSNFTFSGSSRDTAADCLSLLIPIAIFLTR